MTKDLEEKRIHLTKEMFTANHSRCLAIDAPNAGNFPRLCFEAELLKRDNFRLQLDTVPPGGYALVKTAET